MEDKPKYQHDCDRCIFMGNAVVINGREFREVDRYYCTGSGSVLIREGDDGPEYASAPVEVLIRAALLDRSTPLNDFIADLLDEGYIELRWKGKEND